MNPRLLVALSLLGAVSLTGTALAAGTNPKEFIQDAIKGDNSEIQLGQLAQQKGGSEGVRTFGRTLASDHSKAKDEAAALAQQIGVTPPNDMMSAAKKEYDKLQKLSGAAFDQEFARYMVSDHKKDIEEFQAMAKKGGGKGASSDTQKVADLARKTLPDLRKHLQMAQLLQKHPAEQPAH
jgi:putative membrane protein